MGEDEAVQPVEAEPLREVQRRFGDEEVDQRGEPQRQVDRVARAVPANGVHQRENRAADDEHLQQRHRPGVRCRSLFRQEKPRQGNAGKKAADGLQTVQRWQAIGPKRGFLHLIGECPDKPPVGIEESGRDDAFKSRGLQHHRQQIGRISNRAE